MNQIQMKILDQRIGDVVDIPAYQTAGSAGLDLYACVDAPLIIQPNECVLIPSGIAVYIQNPNYCGQLVPRSGLGHKKGLILGNSIGIIDADYQGEIKISTWNRSSKPQEISPMERIAQLIFIAISRPTIQLVSKMKETDRGESGFGSTGSKLVSTE